MNAGYEVTAFISKQRSGLRMSTVMTYTKVNGYLIPNLTYKSGEQMEQLGKYGFLRRDYSQKIDLCLNEGDEVVDCDLIIICEHEIEVGIMRKIG